MEVLFVICFVLAFFCLLVAIWMISLLSFSSGLNRLEPLYQSDPAEFVKRIQEKLDKTHSRVKRNALLLQLCLGWEKLGKAQKALNMIQFVGDNVPFLDKPLYYFCLCRFNLECGNREVATRIFKNHRDWIEKMGAGETKALAEEIG